MKRDGNWEGGIKMDKLDGKWGVRKKLLNLSW